jgi:hypothetical protein
LTVASGFVQCGARTELELVDQAPARAGSTSSADVDAGTAASGPPIDPAVCVAFLPRWRLRAEDTTADCEFCLVYGSCQWPNVADCGPGTACVANHCTTVKTADALCSCIEGCFSAQTSTCDARWSKFMTCATDACATACPSRAQ